LSHDDPSVRPPVAIVSTDPLEWVNSHWLEEELGEPGGMLALTSVLRLREVLAGTVKRELEPSGLSGSDYLLLMTIKLSKDGSRPLSHIARAMMVHPTTVTQAVDRLERIGLVERRPHPTDRRTTLATLTPRGDEVCVAMTGTLRGIGFGMPNVETAELYDLVRVITPIRTACGDIQPVPQPADRQRSANARKKSP
jgi:DNA-binding MarR family transcriptional regulator